MPELFRYAAFISYSSKDVKFARRLHRALESYDIPSSLGKFDLIGGGGKANRVYPVFRDREELSAGQLGDQIEASLKASAALIVVSSPNGAASPWVQKEIEFFAAQGRHAKIFAIIPDTAPLIDETGADATQSCFPPALRGDALTGDKLAPLAADARKGKDAFRLAYLKVIAGMIAVSPGKLVDRDKQRRGVRRFATVAAVVSLLALGSLAAGISEAFKWRNALLSEARTLLQEGKTIDAIAFSVAGSAADGNFLAPGGGATDINLQSLHFGRAITRVLGDFPASTRFSLSPSGRTAVAQRVSNTPTGPQLAGTALLMDTTSGDAFTLEQSVAGGAFSPDDRRFAAQAGDGAGFLLDRRTGLITALGPLHQLSGTPVFSANGNHVAVLTLKSAGLVIDANTGEKLSLGTLESRPEFSPDSAHVVAVAHEATKVISLETGSRVVLGKTQSFSFSPVSHLAAFVSARSEAFLIDLHTSALTPLHATSAYYVQFLPSGLLLIGTSMGVHEIRDVKLGKRHALGQSYPLNFSEDGEYLIEKQRGLGGLLALVEIESGKRIVLPDDVEWADFFGDGSKVAVARQNGANFILDIRTHERVALPPLPTMQGTRLYWEDSAHYVGRTEAGWTFIVDFSRRQNLFAGRVGALTSSGDSWIMQADDGRAFVMNPDLVERAGATAEHLAAAICEADSGPSLRPLSRGVRDSAQPAVALEDKRRRQTLDEVLRGRPWNPCDWRGLAAVFPNRSRGDEWFEGARQWGRLLLIRAGVSADYKCGEINSAGEVREDRVRSCRLFGVSGGRLADQ